MTAALQEEAFGAQKELAKLRTELALAKSASLASEAVQLDSGARMLVARLDGADNKSLQVPLACYPCEAHAGPHLFKRLVIFPRDTLMCDAGKQTRARWCRHSSLKELASFLSETLCYALQHTEGLEPCCMSCHCSNSLDPMSCSTSGCS